MLYPLIRRWLFAMDPEVAHHKTLALLEKTRFLRPSAHLSVDPVKVMGLTFPNRVGLAAGLDKNGEYISALGKLGFGFIEVGTVTPKAQAGNPQPRLFRLQKYNALINRMGFNNEGVEQLVNNVQQADYNGILGINIGKNKTTPNELAINDYLTAMQQVYPYADYIAVNISSPNTPGLRDLQSEDALKLLLEKLKQTQQVLSTEFGYKPVVVKIAPDLSDDEIMQLGKTFTAFAIDGVIATNTTINKQAVADAKYGNEEGGLSGEPLCQRATRVVELLAKTLEQQIPIIAVGGIMNAKDAQAKIAAGASLVQVYSGLVYRGPRLIKEINQTLRRQ